MRIPSALYRDRKRVILSRPSQVLRLPVTKDRLLSTKHPIFIWSQFYKAQKPSDWRPKDPVWTIHFMFRFNGPWMTAQKYDCAKREWSKSVEWKERQLQVSKGLSECPLLHPFSFWAWVGPFGKGSDVCGPHGWLWKDGILVSMIVSEKRKARFHGLWGAG